MKINTEKCTGCGLCAEKCPCKGIEIKEKKAYLSGNCIKCGHCYAVCPTQAWETEFYNLPETETGKILYSRRSSRNFTDRKISNETIEKIIRESSAYPSATNQKCAEVTFITDSSVLKKIKLSVMKSLKDRFKLMDYGICRFFAKIILKSNYERAIKYKKLFDSITEDNDILTFNAPCLVFVHGNRNRILMDEDTHYVTYNIILTAEEEGIGSCFMGFIRSNINRKIKDIAGIPKENDVYSVFILGYPSNSFARPVPQPEIKHNII